MILPSALRDYQHDAVERLRASYRAGHRAPLLQLPTGGGKTVIFSHIARRQAAVESRVYILLHRRELVKQVVGALGVRHGVIAGGFSPNPLAPIQVCSVQSLARKLHTIPSPDMIVIDEAHHAPAGQWAKIIAAYPKARVLGVTATPIRLDGKGLGDMFDDLIIGPSVKELTERGYLAPAVVYAPSTIDTGGIKTQMGDWTKKDLAAAADKPSITGDAIAHYRRYADRKPAVAFCVSIAHAQHVADNFSAAGYRAKCVDGKMDVRERDAAITALGNGGLDVLTSCDIISEGVDVPVIECGILLRPTQSMTLAIQQMGRCLRPSPGKRCAIILDHAGNCVRHGLPDTDREWTLTTTRVKGSRNTEQSVAIRQCPQCYRVHPPAPTCPVCGFVYPVVGREIDEREGELVRLEATRAEVRQAARAADSLESLEELETRAKYKPGWALHRYRQNGGDVTPETAQAYFDRVAAARGYKPGWARYQVGLFLGQGVAV